MLRRGEIKDPLLAKVIAECLADDLEAGRRGEQDDAPIDLNPPDQPPDVTMQVGEEQRGEMPDRFLRTQLAKAAAGESATDREGQRDEFARDERGNADH